MIFKHRLFLVCTVLVLCSCASVSQEQLTLTDAFYPEASQVRKTNWKKLVGTWYGSQKTKDGGTYSWIIRRNNLGLYKLDGKATKLSGEVQSQIEVGEWGAGSTIYFTIFRGWVEGDKIAPSDPSDSYNRDIYKILKLTESEFQYQHLDNGESFSVKKVADDFQMP